MVRAYERLRHISTGRFGAAFLIQAGGNVAMMKTIDIGRLDSAGRKEVLEEVGVLASLRHPHLTAVQECFIEGGYLCLVLQYANGGHAAGQIEKARKSCTDLPEPQILRWFTQATLGLKHMHDKSVIHRDLRTRRLLLTADGHVVLSCAALTPLLRPTLSQERPDLEAMRYLSPELVAGSEHTAACDMWSLGAILYELASLSPPFNHSHPRGLAERILSGPPRSLPARCSKELQNLCSSLMQRRAEDRLTSTDTLRQTVIQERLCKLFDEEPPYFPGAGLATPRIEAAAATPRRGGFGALLLQTPVLTPRGLRHIGEQVTGIKCGSLGATGTITLRSQSRISASPFSTHNLRPSSKQSSLDDRQKFNSAGLSMGPPKENSVSESVLSPEAPQHYMQQVTNEMASEHAKAYAGIMVETALEELNFTSSRLLEEDVPLGRFSLPTAVDSTSGATWQIGKNVVAAPSIAQGTRCCDIAPPAHSREFPRFS